jgi:hypothetical protein
MISLISALEIFSNPSDLEFVIGQEKEGGKFAIGIYRGPGHNYKPIVTSRPFTEKFEDAVEEIEKLLNSVHESVTAALVKKDSFLEGLVVSDSQQVLNPELITRIIDELRQNKKASTCKMFAHAG